MNCRVTADKHDQKKISLTSALTLIKNSRAVNQMLQILIVKQKSFAKKIQFNLKKLTN